jgi:dUTPase
VNNLKNVKLIMNDVHTKEPMRSTIGSAGYDIFASSDIYLPAREEVTIELPFKFAGDVNQNKKVRVFVRSSYGIKKKVRIVVDGNKTTLGKTLNMKDERHFLTLLNDGDVDLLVQKGEHFAQFIVTDEQPSEEKNVLQFLSEEELNGVVPIRGHVEIVRPNVYDFVLDESVELNPNEQNMLPSGVRTVIEDGTWTAVVPHEEIANKVMLANQTAVIDRDYAFNESTKGNCFFALVNLTSEAIVLKPGTRITRWFSEKYYTFEGEVKTNVVRTGGIGHTSKTS